MAHIILLAKFVLLHKQFLFPVHTKNNIEGTDSSILTDQIHIRGDQDIAFVTLTGPK
jgi:hypothetical protein